MTNIYINIATVGNFNEVLIKILTEINLSGLYDNVDKIYLVVNGNDNLLDVPHMSKYVYMHPNDHIGDCEFPTLDLIWRHSQENDDLTILYLHTKGVTKPNSAPVRDWVDYLTYFNVIRWQDMLVALKEGDAVGVNHGGNPDDYNEHPQTWGYGKAPLHFSGNFWWSKSSYIKRLVSPYGWCPDNNYTRWRVMCEMWVCSGGGQYKGLWHSNKNHYMETYKRSEYFIAL